MIWIFGTVLVLACAGYLALQVAIARNGPAVLDTVDRVTGPETNFKRLETVRFGKHPSQKLVVIRPEDAPENVDLPVVVFFHGGSWKDGDPEDYGFVGRGFASHGFVTVLAGYRLGEDGKYPAMLEDGASALAWVHANIALHDGKPDHIVLMGHSAGAYNAAMLALDDQWLAESLVPAASIKGVVGLAGPYDFYPFDSDSTKATFGHTAEPQTTQPVNFARESAPPFLLIHGEKDTTVKPRNSHALERQLAEAGAMVEIVTFSDMDHTAPLLQLASPWRGRTDLAERVRQFIANPQTSVPVQPESR